MMHLQPDCLFDGNRFVTGLGVTIDANGALVAVATHAPENATTIDLSGKALMPGFINSHSHVFQRLLRGRTEEAQKGASFWSWRDAMYSVAAKLTPEDVGVIAEYTFGEMVRAGYTTVKEFHYLHHGPDGRPYADPHEISRRLVAAATAAGIDIHLLRVAYPMVNNPVQKRFADRDIETAIERTAELVSQMNVPVGIAPHSIRAVDPQGFAAAAQWARDTGVECHAHVAEQPKELEWSVKTYGATPMQLLADNGVFESRFTAVHATHLSDTEIRLAGSAGITTCLCPTTEANLGDGVPKTRELLDAGTQLAIGSDSQAEINPFAELRLAEYNERNRLGQRRILNPNTVLNAVTESLEIGAPARLIALDMSHPALIGVDTNDLGSAVVMAGQPDCVTDIWRGDSPLNVTLPIHDYQTLAKRLR